MEANTASVDPQERLLASLASLNESLASITPYRLEVFDPQQIKLLDKNARYMSKNTFDRLVENVKEDGNLGSIPLLWKHDGVAECISGNHRVMAAGQAGVKSILCLVTSDQLTLSQKRSIQISHNAIVGVDDPNLLKDLWKEIEDIESKIYSGLDDQFFEKLPQPSLLNVPDMLLRFEKLEVFFLPPDAEKIETIMKQLSETEGKKFVAPLEAWDKFFETFVKIKEAKNIENSGTALMAMVEIVEEHLAQHNKVQQN